jgi:hypothetical protein
MRKRRIKLLNNKYIIAYHIQINKGTKAFYVRPKMSSRTPGCIPLAYIISHVKSGWLLVMKGNVCVVVSEPAGVMLYQEGERVG